MLLHVAVQEKPAGSLTMSVSDHQLLSPARMPLRLDGHWPAQFERSRFGASIELLGFGLDRTMDVFVGAPGFDDSAGAVLLLRVDQRSRLGPTQNSSSDAAVVLSSERIEAPVPDGVGPGCQFGTALATFAQTNASISDQEVHLLVASPGCSGRGLLAYKTNTTRLYSRPPWMLPVAQAQQASLDCSAQQAMCSALNESLPSDGMGAVPLTVANAVALGAALDAESARDAAAGWNGEALLRHVAQAGCLLSDGELRGIKGSVTTGVVEHVGPVGGCQAAYAGGIGDGIAVVAHRSMHLPRPSELGRVHELGHVWAGGVRCPVSSASTFDGGMSTILHCTPEQPLLPGVAEV